MFLWLGFVLLFAVVCAVVGYLLVILNGERILSQNFDKLTNIGKSSLIVDASGNELKTLSVAGGNREYVSISEIPKKVQQAFVAVEDKRFYEHGGVDIWGIGRALVTDIVERRKAEGASTITQQVARRLFLNADKTFFRKGTEASIALAMENHKSKDEILELYLNLIDFGHGQLGIKSAAKYYFNIDDLNDLNTAQIAILVGIPKAQNTYNPVSNPEKSLERRGVVLSVMKEQGLITEQEEQEAAAWKYTPPASTKASASKYATFIDYVKQEAEQVTGYSEEQLLTGGYTIYTTIDVNAQKALESVFADDNNFEKSKDDKPIQGSMVIMDQHNGELKAMIGGRDYQSGNWNRVDKQRQAGSSFKPIAVYGPAFETGDWFPWSQVQDQKVCYDNGKYCPSNDSGEGYLGTTTVTEALTDSRNQPAVWLLNQIGVQKGIDFASKLGIQLSPADRNLAIALGGLTDGVSPLQMARAYGAFANGGTLQDEHSILKITNSEGKSIYEYKSKAKQVMSEKTAYYVTEALKSVVTEGTGVKAKISGRTVAGKTGTTQLGIPGVKSSGNRDIWFVGYTPEWTAAVWMGYDQTDKDHYVKKSSGQAAALFSKVMSAALKGQKKQSFPKPDGVDQQEEQAKAPDPIQGLMASYDPVQVSVELNWAPSPEGITYKIYRKGGEDADFKQLAESAEPNFSDLSILPDMTYTYYVTAYNATNQTESAPSSQVSVTVTSDMVSPPPDETQTPPPDGSQSPPPDGSQTLPPDGSQTPPPDGSQTPPPDGSQTPPPDGSQTPPPDGSQTPPPDGSQTPPPRGDGGVQDPSQSPGLDAGASPSPDDTTGATLGFGKGKGRGHLKDAG
ncbi:PBP1A family penicillin-binding protein [Cohnella zeiphila]|uniref:PBP1A family penicillin-binding protein n=1 Tax=Cohnella zeiphila TaxID=2761120 RepID=UPI00308023CC